MKTILYQTASQIKKDESVWYLFVVFFALAILLTGCDATSRMLAYSSTSILYIRSATPTQLSVNGGTILHLTGRGFKNGMTIHLGQVQCNHTQVESSDKATCVVGTYQELMQGSSQLQRGNRGALQLSKPLIAIKADVSGQIATLLQAFEFLLPPSISKLSDSNGNVLGGNTITLTGQNFFADSQVFFGTTPCQNLVLNSDSSLNCTVPPTTVVGPVIISITNPDGQTGQSSTPYTYFIPAPKISSLTPWYTHLAGGQSLSLQGSAFLPGATVTLGGVTCSNPQITPSQISCTIPAGSEGAALVVVMNPDLQNDSISGFSYIVAPFLSQVHPQTGKLAGGELITLTGTNFRNGDSVTLGNQNCALQSLTSTQITCLTPSQSAVGIYDVSVASSHGDLSTLSNAFNYYNPSLIIVSPSVGRETLPTVISFSGVPFPNQIQSIKAGSVTCLNLLVTGSTLNCQLPPGVGTNVTVELITQDGQNLTAANPFTFAPAPVLQSFSPNTGLVSGQYLLSITGNHFNSGSQIYFDNTLCTSVHFIDVAHLECQSVPANAAGNAVLSVLNPDGQKGTSASFFLYQLSPANLSIYANAQNLGQNAIFSFAQAQVVGQPTQASQIFTIQNTPASLNAQLQFSTIDSSFSNHFTLISNSCSQSTIPAGQNCSLEIAFTPAVSASGTLTGNLSGTYADSSGTSTSISIQVTGVAKQPAKLQVLDTLVITSFDFQTKLVSSITTQNFTLQNTGEAVATLSSASVNAPFSIVGSPFALNGVCTSINPGSSCTFQIQYNPSSPGIITQNLQLTFNNGASLITNQTILTLTGKGMNAASLLCDIGSLSVPGDTCVINTPHTITNGSWIEGLGNLEIRTGGSLTTQNNQDSFTLQFLNGNIWLRNDLPSNPAKPYIKSNLNIFAITLVIDAGTSIDASGLGYLGNAFNSGAGFIAYSSGVAGQSGGGGAHAGFGQNALDQSVTNHGWGGSATYGNLQQPVTAGSAGGGSIQLNYPIAGGNGGGVIHITLSTHLTLNGKLSADGKAGDFHTNYNFAGGGGAGGSIWIETPAVSGNGLLSAKGGNGGGDSNTLFPGGGGGGGRIAMSALNKFSGSISILAGQAAGYSKVTGEHGSFYQPNHNICDVGTLSPTNTSSICQITTPTYLSENIVSAGSIQISSTGKLFPVNPDLSYSIQLAGDLFLTKNAIISGNINSLTANNITVYGSLIGNLTSVQANTFSILQNSDGTKGIVSADGLGYKGLIHENGFGPADGTFGYAGYSGGGGAHGGVGHNSIIFSSSNPGFGGNIVYDNPQQPILAGAAGGGSLYGNLPWIAGGNGGGVIHLSVSGTLTVNGILSANGLAGDYTNGMHWAAGGGAGGSVWLEAAVVSGNGLISVNGGNGGGTSSTLYPGGGGGGGMIAVHTTQNLFSSSGGIFSTVAGSCGTIASSTGIGACGTKVGTTAAGTLQILP